MNKNPSFLNLKKNNLRAFVSLNRSSIAWHGQARQQSSLCACMPAHSCFSGWSDPAIKPGESCLLILWNTLEDATVEKFGSRC